MAKKKGRKKLTLTKACQQLLIRLEKDLHKALKVDPAPGEESRLDEFKAEWTEAKDEGRTAKTFNPWMNDLVTQIGASWVLSCVFVRFCEDNDLVDRPWISGPVDEDPSKDRRKRAQDTEQEHYKENPSHGPREYLQHIFRKLSKLPGLDELLDPAHALLWRLSPRSEGGRLLVDFFRELHDESGQLNWEFTDDALGTRFLGDLYQDLSESARKTYALKQTPHFIQEFLLDRTLEPAIETFGLEEVRMIDPTCGSGHFLLGSFQRLLDHWLRKEPGTNPTELARRALDAVHGVDVNPFAVAITRFRLLVVAVRSCGVTHLADAPHFLLHVAVGDSLIHGCRFAEVRGQQLEVFEDTYGHLYGHELDPELRRILTQQYHAVLGNPPYITPKDAALNKLYRAHYGSCSGKYALSVPFMERFVELAIEGKDGKPAGYIGKITSNSFMKREFGGELVEKYFELWDLTHVIDTSGAYIPEHGTPTVILCFRNQLPTKGKTVRTVLGIRGEPATPSDPAQGLVWSAIVDQVDRPGSESKFVSVEDIPHAEFTRHPWCLGGGGARELLKKLSDSAQHKLGDQATEIGFLAVTGEDGFFVAEPGALSRAGFGERHVRAFCEGTVIRDWSTNASAEVLFPYVGCTPDADVDRVLRFAWPQRTTLRKRLMFSKTQEQRGEPWWGYAILSASKTSTPLSIAFAFVATHNHFVLDRGGKVFKQSAPVIKLPPEATEDDHFALLAILNSSTACFWMQQVFHNKGGPGGGSSKDEKWKDFYEHDSTKLQQLPIPDLTPRELARQCALLGEKLSSLRPMGHEWKPEGDAECQREFHEVLGRLVWAQEELDWTVMHQVGLTEEKLLASSDRSPVKVLPGQRPFEIVAARQVESGELVTRWFELMGGEFTTEVPVHWPEWYRELSHRRIQLIESDRYVALVESMACKRRWEKQPWPELREAALDAEMLGAIEALPIWKVEQPTVVSIAQLAETLERDGRFVTLLRLRTGEEAPGVERAIAKLVKADSVPFLPVLYLKDSGLQKRESWEEAWEKQRIEDPFLDQQDVQLQSHFGSSPADQKRARKHVACWLTTNNKVTKERELSKSLPDAEAEKTRLAELRALGKLRDAWHAVDKARRGAIGGATPPVPTKYKNADFLGKAWLLRGKLDVPKERFISYPHCSPDGDDSLLIGWAGWDHAQQAAALADMLQARQDEGWTGIRCAPILLGIDQLLPWLKQWHGDEVVSAYRVFLEDGLRKADLTIDEVRAWKPA